MNNLGVIVLAAGLGKRMKSELPKVLHRLGGKPLLSYALATARSLKPKKIAVVVGHGAEQVKEACDGGDIAWVLQEKQLGTGHAVACAAKTFRDFEGDILILNGDVPFITEETLIGLLRRHHEEKATLTFITARLAKPQGYGRIVRNAKGEIARIVEERDATLAEKKITEINAGIYAVAPGFLFPALESLSDHNEQNEYYLTDIVAAALRGGESVRTVEVKETIEIMGVNTREELALMEKLVQETINRKWMAAGVTLKDPETTYIEEGVKIGRDTIVGPNTHLLGETVIGERCRIDGSAYLTDARLADGVHLRFSVVLSDCKIADGAIVGPFAHLRPGTQLGRQVHIGNFVETKEAQLGDGVKANHLTYLGDVTVGRETKIGRAHV